MIKICGCLMDEVLIRIVEKRGGGVRIYFIDVYVSCDICIVYVECKVERVYKL